MLLPRRGAGGGGWRVELTVAAGLIIAPFILPWIGLNADTMARIMIWGLFGLGFDLLFGYTGLLSFGQAAFFGTGGFISAYLLVNGLVPNVYAALLIGTLLAAVYGAVIGVFALRRIGIYFAMITLAFGEMSFFLENSPLSAFTGGENGLPGVPAPVLHLGVATIVVKSGEWSMYGFMAALFLVGFVLARRIVKSPFGAVLMAIRENTPRAIACGHSVQKYKLTIFIVAAAYGGFAGGLLGILQAYMPPDAFALQTSGQLVMQTVIGGSGTLIGPLLGATIWLYLREVLQHIPEIGALWKLILGAVFVILVTLFRRGICGEILRYMQPRPTGGPAEPATGSASPTRPRSADETGTPPASVQPRTADDAPVVLETRGLSKHFGGVHAVTTVDFTVRAGEVRALIGPNGAGKSTFFKMLTGEHIPTAGDIFFRGERITKHGPAAVSQLGMSKSYQINQLFVNLTVRQNLTIPVLARQRGAFRLDMLRRLARWDAVNAKVESLMALMGLSERADQPTSVLAYGEKRRLEIGLALAMDPEVLLLDEPLAGMSPSERADTVALLQRLRVGRTLIVVEHDMDAIFELAEHITVFYEGEKLAEGTPEHIKGHPKVQEAYLGGMEENELA
ncbi:branched-chain amino acid ABC transporter ATP-binding protein/permease [Salinisphaera sp. LB1]|uniref:branched-chain amino acid ABC transporter ATP-binding protein/permease n=1 Tax=Salinisphaera sp. LB1 TaxID=2183911 RepID=UPI0015CFA761